MGVAVIDSLISVTSSGSKEQLQKLNDDIRKNADLVRNKLKCE